MATDRERRIVRYGLLAVEMKNYIRLLAGLVIATASLRGDEQLFGFVRGAETLPAGRAEVYQFTTFRTGKDSGTYYGLDFDTEVEYGFTDEFQASASLVNHYFYNRNVDGLDNSNGYRFGGGELSAKYRLLSPFKDPIGFALRLESGYLLHDEVDGLPQHEVYLAPELDLQKNFLDDTLIVDVNLGPEWAWGKLPAEQYSHEISLQAGTGISYRFAPNWFIGLESRIRAEYPLFDFGNFEHAVVYAGPSIHYSSKRWWATLTWVYQAWGHGVDEPQRGQTFAEETRQAFRLKVGFNF